MKVLIRFLSLLLSACVLWTSSGLNWAGPMTGRKAPSGSAPARRIPSWSPANQPATTHFFSSRTIYEELARIEREIGTTTIPWSRYLGDPGVMEVARYSLEPQAQIEAEDSEFIPIRLGVLKLMEQNSYSRWIMDPLDKAAVLRALDSSHDREVLVKAIQVAGSLGIEEALDHLETLSRLPLSLESHVSQARKNIEEKLQAKQKLRGILTDPAFGNRMKQVLNQENPQTLLPVPPEADGLGGIHSDGRSEAWSDSIQMVQAVLEESQSSDPLRRSASLRTLKNMVPAIPYLGMKTQVVTVLGNLLSQGKLKEEEAKIAAKVLKELTSIPLSPVKPNSPSSGNPTSGGLGDFWGTTLVLLASYPLLILGAWVQQPPWDHTVFYVLGSIAFMGGILMTWGLLAGALARTPDRRGRYAKNNDLLGLWISGSMFFGILSVFIKFDPGYLMSLLGVFSFWPALWKYGDTRNVSPLLVPGLGMGLTASPASAATPPTLLQTGWELLQSSLAYTDVWILMLATATAGAYLLDRFVLHLVFRPALRNPQKIEDVGEFVDPT